jgi:hypothetical protein
MAGKSKYSLNKSYFQKVDSEEKAYWLGFILADGYIGIKNKKESFIEIGLHIKDVNHLEKFKKCVDYNGPIHFRKNMKGCRLVINSQEFVSYLVLHGIKNNKSLTANPIYFEDDFLQKSFWRGVLDGDGTIFKLKPKDRKELWVIGLYGTKSIVSAFAEYSKKFIQTKSNNLEKRHNVYRWSVSSNKYCKKLIHHFYNDAKIFLDRKKKFLHVE